PAVCPFLLILRPAPRPTLFPYTTLFRSPQRIHIIAGVGIFAADHLQRCIGHRQRRQPARVEMVIRAPRVARDAGNAEVEDLGGADRKSTRLNSSHVKTSYAVFCLKKKKM